ncbi:hypothetical protein QVD17_37571 [Tagetes erecta]|uniref:Uncharacterized protein n=1 Tax=Tagetes erecta TaxID=13708 RepID=A0AAD8JYI2_TARER|nr:hypothetical protein QVD17_37571 [Tagetes erecta]
MSLAKDTLANKMSDITSIEEELLDRFVPDDVCPMNYGSIDIMLNKGRAKDEVAPLFSLDDDICKPNSEMTLETSNLLSVDQLLESVMESAQQVGRMSVCNAPNMSFMELTNVMNMQHGPEYQNIGVQSGDSPRMEQSATSTSSVCLWIVLAIQLAVLLTHDIIGVSRANNIRMSPKSATSC